MDLQALHVPRGYDESVYRTQSLASSLDLPVTYESTRNSAWGRPSWDTTSSHTGTDESKIDASFITVELSTTANVALRQQIYDLFSGELQPSDAKAFMSSLHHQLKDDMDKANVPSHDQTTILDLVEWLFDRYVQTHNSDELDKRDAKNLTISKSGTLRVEVVVAEEGAAAAARIPTSLLADLAALEVPAAARFISAHLPPVMLMMTIVPSTTQSTEGGSSILLAKAAF